MKRFRSRMLATGLAVTVVLGSTGVLEVQAIKGGEILKSAENQGVELISTNGLKDVPENYFAKEQIEKYVSEGVLEGYPDGTFKPNESITRAEFVKIVNKVFKLEEKESGGTKTFTDVKEGAWYARDVKIAVENGYINGFEDNTFRPNEKITREQVAKVLGMLLNIGREGVTTFTDDSNISSWAKPYVEGLKEEGILSGYPTGEFKPKEGATRGEGIALISNCESYKEGVSEGGVVPPNTEGNQGGGTNDNNNNNNNNNDNNNGNNNDNNNGNNNNDNNNGNKDNDSSNTEENQESVSNLTDLKEALLDPAKTTVEYTGVGVISETIEIPEGKTLILKGDTTITNEIKVVGGLEVEGIVKIDNGGVLKIEDKGVSRVKTLKGEEEAKIKGEGQIQVNNGVVEVRDITNLQVDFSVMENSTLKIGEVVWLDGKTNQTGENLITMTKKGTVLTFDFNSAEGSRDYVTVDGGIVLNDTFRLFVFKSANEESSITLPNRLTSAGYVNDVRAELYGKGEVIGGAYTGSTGGNWIKKDKVVTIKTKVKDTTSSTVIKGEESLYGGIGVSRDTSKEKYEEETRIKLLDYYSNEMETTMLDTDEVKEFRVLINLGQKKDLVGLKINGVYYDIESKISQEINPGDLVTLNIRAEDYEKLGINEAGATLEIEAVEYENVEYKEGAIEVKTQVIQTTSSATTEGTIGGQQVTVSGVEVSASEKEVIETEVDFKVKGKSVSSFDMTNIGSEEEIEIIVRVGKGKELAGIVLNSHNVIGEGIVGVREGNEVKLKIKGKDLHNLIYVQTDYEEFTIVVYER